MALVGLLKPDVRPAKGAVRQNNPFGKLLQPRPGDFAFDAGRILRFSVLAVVLFLAVANHRSFCKIMCPIGAMVALTNKFSFLSLRLDGKTCIHCKKCDQACPMDVAVEPCSVSGRKINRHPECIECLTCEEVCPVTAIGNNSKLLSK